MQANVTFMFEKRTTVIQCTIKEEMQKIFEKFDQKIYSNLDDFNFFYENNIVNGDSTFLELTNDENINNIIITAEKK